MAFAVGGVTTAVVVAAKTWKRNDMARFAVVTSLIFAGQMLNFPVSGGTSGEGLITGAVFLVLNSGEKTLNVSSGKLTLTFAATCGAVLFLSPLASNLPDGLEMVAEVFNLVQGTDAARFAPFADYRLPAVGNVALATGLAGLGGVLLTFGGALLVGQGIRARAEKGCS